MTDVDVAILHVESDESAGPLVRATATARLDLAERHRRGFLAAGATRATIVAATRDALPFGARARRLAAELGPGGLVVLGSGAIPLARAADRRELVSTAASSRPIALTNNRYSGDVVAIACARSVLAEVPDLPTDNALPRWLQEVAGVRVDDRRGRRRLGVDIDGAADLVLLGGRWRRFLHGIDVAVVERALDGVRAVTSDARAELIIAGRLSGATLAWLESHTASRTRALIEERGLRTRRPDQRPAASVFGALLDHDGPGSLGKHLARLGDAAIVDTRVLLAHRFGPEEADWPPAEDRYASDLLLADRIADQWLRALTASAATAPIPVLLGGHTLVGPGLPLAFRRRR